MDRKQEVLALLKTRGTAGLRDVAERLGISRQGALRHLDALTRAGLVEAAAGGRSGPGRPPLVYRLAPAARERFPSSHRQLAVELVDFMEEDQLERFFTARTARIEAGYAARLAGLTFEGRVRELARMASEHGHMTEVITDARGSITLRHCHCPIQDAASRGGLACRHEKEMYERLLGAEVARVEWLGAGGAACSYRVQQRGMRRNIG